MAGEGNMDVEVEDNIYCYSSGTELLGFFFKTGPLVGLEFAKWTRLAD